MGKGAGLPARSAPTGDGARNRALPEILTEAGAIVDYFANVQPGLDQETGRRDAAAAELRQRA